MSTYCAGCRFDPKLRAGPDACPVAALYWDFMARHAGRFEGNQVAALRRLGPERLAAHSERAAAFRAELSKRQTR